MVDLDMYFETEGLIFLAYYKRNTSYKQKIIKKGGKTN